MFSQGAEKMTDLDRIDRKILKALQADGRIATVELAEKVGLSPTSTGERVKRLELRLHASMATEERLVKLSEIVRKHAGATPIAVALLMPGEAEALIGGTSFKVQVSDELLESVNRLFGARVAELG